MANNNLKVQRFRENDLSNDTGKQFELGKSWCEFFNIDEQVGEIEIPIYFKSLSSEYSELDNKKIILKLSGLSARNDRKVYANGAATGHSAIKEFFLYDLRLNSDKNRNDYFAIYKASNGFNYLYYIPEILYKNFISFFESVTPVVSLVKESSQICNSDNSLQQIFYGAPGTGKSHTIKGKTETAEKEDRLVRTTFHPDSDYSTFVGAYKPTKANRKNLQRMNLSLEDLAKELGSYYTNEVLGKINGIQKFCYEYCPYIDGEYMSVNVTKLLELAGVPQDYNVEINKYIKFCHLLPKQDTDKITYEFVPQAFTKAYVKAWNTREDIYLVIEEINRGNCAQIFGDLFQLLDRKNGRSKYPIDSDTDLEMYLSNALAESTRDDFPEGVKEGKKLVLPENLYIWATMNTSDQSLFPIDSAFKRRWNWNFMKIRNYSEKDFKIVIGEEKYDWWEFIKKINDIIASMTSSADKQLGYFFCTPENGGIDEKLFVSKVIFYLWNDVFKDYGFEDASLFQYAEIGEDGKEVTKDLTFPDFYDENGIEVNTVRLKAFLENVKNWKKTNEENS